MVLGSNPRSDTIPQMAKLVDAQGSELCDRNIVPVQIRLWGPTGYVTLVRQPGLKPALLRTVIDGGLKYTIDAGDCRVRIPRYPTEFGR